MENRSHALMTGFFTIALLVATVLAGIWFNRDRVERVPYQIATIQSIPGLNPQAAVRYRGLEVGKVDDISFDTKIPGQILIRLSVDAEAPITRTTFATLGYQGVTGIAFIQLDDEKTGSPLLASNANAMARIPLRPGLLDQLEKRGLVILDKAEELTARLDALAAPENQKIILDAFANVSKAAIAYGEIPARLEPTLARLPQLTAKAEQSFAAFDTFSNNASTMTRSYTKLADDLQAPNGAIARLNSTVDRVGGSLEAVTTDLEMQTLPHFVAMTDEARTSLRAVRRTMNSLNDRPQSLLFGAAPPTPGPGEPGFTAPTK
ncbi:MlaD family protein [Massilia antarctica]|uniref:MlaD family protein n=1 Tax=Massilia antarctica TaxID=2765360 RepID=UPI0006BB79AB|nr:MlaD family protein [Massilia sp. H27-R4]MCY0916096.1 MlaD family protein [Massilia sp. H27-R4]CUI05933.1 ABC-type transport system involved in resistance to organic solvents, periplasmic component [Janthinobacterium sp. CG23_2]CUU29719.1 ABC-type transport system involved in resistance to organic solvents, periplasmic component [Janthinobacterium sp. CG23_2]